MQLSLADQESRFLCYCVSFPYFLNFWVWGRVEEPQKRYTLYRTGAKYWSDQRHFAIDRVSYLPERVADENCDFSIRPFCVIIIG